MEKFNANDYKNKFSKENYDRITILVPKGQKDVIKKKASELNVSVNEYINSLIRKDMNI
ncbi:MAG: hypothetical protein K6G26_10330 [Lachnospiraceae bacterium]|nr:hypothetical protein [Lachnospiraceae bacterium]